MGAHNAPAYNPVVSIDDEEVSGHIEGEAGRVVEGGIGREPAIPSVPAHTRRDHLIILVSSFSKIRHFASYR